MISLFIYDKLIYFINKLYIYGVRGVALHLIKYYFDNRRQYILFGSVDSETLIQNLGVI